MLLGMKTDTENLISVTELANNTSRIIAEAADGRPRVILKNNRVAAVLMSAEAAERLGELDEVSENLQLWALALVRSMTDSGERHSLEEVATEFGVDLDEDDEGEDDK